MAMAPPKNSASIDNDGEFTICITSPTPPPPLLSSSSSTAEKVGRKHSQKQQQQQGRLRFNLWLKPSSSLEQLHSHVFALFNIPEESKRDYHLSFLGGYPPKELQTQGKETVHEMGIRPNDMLIVKFALSSGNAMVEKGKDDNGNEQDSGSNAQELTKAEASSTETGRQKRASAIAATANFRNVIDAQDAILSNNDNKNKRSSPMKKPRSAGGTTNIAGLGNLGKRTAVKSGSATTKRPKLMKMEGPGYRLSDGLTVAGSSPVKKSTNVSSKQTGKQPMFNSEDDVANKLLNSLGGGGSGGNVNQYLRAAMRNAVEKSYEASRASVRVAAVNNGEYSFKKVDSVVDGERTSGDEMLRTTSRTVSYSKGIEGRGYFEEEVEIIGLDVLKSVLESVYNSDSSSDCDDDKVGDGSNDGRLRPVLIAQLSPRVFWSLVYHCSDAAKIDHGTMRQSVEDMLRSTLPQLDWSHLDRGGRMRVLSEKARENLKQRSRGTALTASQASLQNHTEEDGIKAVEELAESIYNTAAAKEDEGTKLSEREMRVNAAMARLQNAHGATSSSSSIMQSPDQKSVESVDNWTLITPVEDDIDELIECIVEGSTTTDGDTTTIMVAQSWAGIIINTIRNWRELANSNPEYILSLFIDDADSPRPSHDTIEQWIAVARARSIEEIMLDILDGDQDAMELLLEKARSSTPRDLLFWRTAPGMLLNTISCTADDTTSTKWTKSDVRRWIARAKTALSVCPWLEMYTTQSIP